MYFFSPSHRIPNRYLITEFFLEGTIIKDKDIIKHFKMVQQSLIINQPDILPAYFFLGGWYDDLCGILEYHLNQEFLS